MSDEWQGWLHEFPSREAVEAHVAAYTPPPSASPWMTGAPWLRHHGDLAVIYLAARDGEVRARLPNGAAWYTLEMGRAGMWRPITALGEETAERDAAQLAIVEALEGHAAQLRGARATITALLRAAEAESADRAERWSKYLADVERLTAERDAAFNRGAEAMREAAMKACERVEDEAELSSEGDVAMRCANRIRALKVAP